MTGKPSKTDSGDLLNRVAKQESGPDTPRFEVHNRPAPEVLSAYLRGLFSVLPKVLRNQWHSPRDIREQALRDLRLTVAYAMEHNPFYARFYAGAGVRPEELTGEEAIGQIPFLTKAHQRADWDELLPSPEAQKKLRPLTSSGSSGAPIRLFYDPIAELPRRFQEIRFLAAHGWKPWHTQVLCEHHDHSVPPRFLVQKLGIWRREPLPWWTGPEHAVRFIDDFKPNIVHGMLSNVKLLALAARSAGGFKHQVDFVAVKGELLDPATRKLVEEIFGAHVVDYYATEETGIIAWECPSGEGYHIDEDLVFLEVVKEDGKPAAPGELGEIVVSNLYMRSMPIIRYRTGDIGTLGEDPCSCGRGLPLLTKLHGRTIHLIVTPSGAVFHPGKLMAILEHAVGVDRFQITQDARDHLSVQVKWQEAFSGAQRADSSATLIGALTELLGAEMRVDVEDVPDLAPLYGTKNPLVRGLPENDFTQLTAHGQKLEINL